MKQSRGRVLSLAIVAVAFVLLPADLWAGSGGDGMPWEAPLESILNSLTGRTGAILTAFMFVAAAVTWGLSRHEEGVKRLFHGAVAGAILMSAVQFADLLGISGGVF